MSHVGPWLAAPLAALALAVAPLCRGRRALEPELVAATPRLSPRARCGARARAGARGLRYGSLPCGAQRRGTPEYARRKRQKKRRGPCCVAGRACVGPAHRAPGVRASTCVASRDGPDLGYLTMTVDMNDYKHSYNAVSIATNRCQESHGAMTALQTGPHFLVATCHPPSSSCCASGSKVHSVSIVHSVPPAAVCGHSSLRFSPADSRISVAADSRRKSAGASAALLVSGWRILALWRYAARISASVQPRSTPTIRNRSSPGVRSVAVPRPPSASRGAGARLLLPPRCGGVNADTARTIIVQGASAPTHTLPTRRVRQSFFTPILFTRGTLEPRAGQASDC